MDCLAQTVDRALSGQTVDRLRKAWIKLAQSVDVGQTVDSYSRHIRASMRARRLSVTDVMLRPSMLRHMRARRRDAETNYAVSIKSKAV